jgi:hypothetical protein
LALAGGGVDIPLAAFAFEINETFQYHYNLSVLPRSGNGQVFAFVHRLEPKPNERMERFLAEQGVFPAQPTTFLSDGGETVRQAQGEFREFGAPILDWFHVAAYSTQSGQ